MDSKRIIAVLCFVASACFGQVSTTNVRVNTANNVLVAPTAQQFSVANALVVGGTSTVSNFTISLLSGSNLLVLSGTETVRGVGTGLTLTNGTVAANIGTGAGTVASGTDPRITGAIQGGLSLVSGLSLSGTGTTLYLNGSVPTSIITAVGSGLTFTSGTVALNSGTGADQAVVRNTGGSISATGTSAFGTLTATTFNAWTLGPSGGITSPDASTITLSGNNLAVTGLTISGIAPVTSLTSPFSTWTNVNGLATQSNNTQAAGTIYGVSGVSTALPAFSPVSAYGLVSSTSGTFVRALNGLMTSGTIAGDTRLTGTVTGTGAFTLNSIPFPNQGVSTTDSPLFDSATITNTLIFTDGGINLTSNNVSGATVNFNSTGGGSFTWDADGSITNNGSISATSFTATTGPSTMTGGLTVDGIAFPDQDVSTTSGVIFNTVTATDYVSTTEFTVSSIGLNADTNGLTVSTGNPIKFTNLPTSDPGVDGQLYRSGTNIYISAGP